MEAWTPEIQAFYDAHLNKQDYKLYLKVKDLPDDTNISCELKNPEGECIHTINAGIMKKIFKLNEELKHSYKTE